LYFFSLYIEFSTSDVLLVLDILGISITEEARETFIVGFFLARLDCPIFVSRLGQLGYLSPNLLIHSPLVPPF